MLLLWRRPLLELHGFGLPYPQVCSSVVMQHMCLAANAPVSYGYEDYSWKKLREYASTTFPQHVFVTLSPGTPALQIQASSPKYCKHRLG